MFFPIDGTLGVLSARDLDGPSEIKFTIKDEVTRSLVRLSEHFGQSTVNRSVEIILNKQLDRDHVSILIDMEFPKNPTMVSQRTTIPGGYQDYQFIVVFRGLRHLYSLITEYEYHVIKLDSKHGLCQSPLLSIAVRIYFIPPCRFIFDGVPFLSCSRHLRQVFCLSGDQKKLFKYMQWLKCKAGRYI